ncbi:MAG: tetratricopeptide repeat protein [Gemmatimonadetes bacterium]|uniref:Tetratricopeptide repeat protein n=1 Tax=Candidatus Kutchimonas denitrificans TaxID=3056748 RepID=A0AAE4Z722_9BACT|nr:tetratricopeptide repeat protein [Gemmatimonadota bacterium]NIR74539.1 tetratricopeptide repeat protein [Candidatus Kutchimonas denitrificans]NIS02729.1 tetratricopeptide repeat protein [Gemmatimonadota bacterium]NIT68890.1 tetratricopeptide repeat protein [Gemmatimonadota bacterium]NIU52195.1 tetratricopeptide repeat protein [Gemmatimonadota bacterium]
MVSIGLSVAALSLVSEARSAVLQQEPGGRFRVLVVPLESSQLDDDFGEDVADRLRDRLDDFTTHAPIAEREYKRALKRYEVEEEDLNKIRARQLGNLMGAQVVYYGTVTEQPNRTYQVDATFIDVATGDEVTVPTMTIRDDSDDTVQQVAQASLQAFEQQVRFLRARAFCADYVGSQQPESALRNCNEALSINPNSVPALYNKGIAFRQLYEANQETATSGTDGWADSAVSYFEEVLQNSPGHREAIQQAAYMYSLMGEAEKAAELYRQYLELDPGNVPVRLKVADDLKNAGLMEQAVKIIQDGLEYTPNDVDLLQFLGDYALNYSSEDSSYVDVALDAYEKILEIKGEETDPRIILNAIAAYTAAGRTDEAIAFAERALQSQSDNARLWSLYADALARNDRHSDAVSAMDTVLAIDPSYANGYARRGQFKLEAGDKQGAMADFNQAIESGSSTRESVFNLFFGRAITARNEGNMTAALDDFELAAEFAPADKRQEVQFWWGYTHYQIGERLADPDDAGLRQLQRAQRNFTAAKQHFQQAGSVRPDVPRFLEATDTWLLNVEARIKQIQRGR